MGSVPIVPKGQEKLSSSAQGLVWGFFDGLPAAAVGSVSE